MVVQLCREGDVFLLQRHCLGILGVFAPGHPDLTDLELAELRTIKTRDVILMRMGSDHDCQFLARGRADIVDNLAYRADVTLAVNSAVDEDVAKTTTTGKRK